MKVKIVGFKVGRARPTYNRTINVSEERFIILGSLFWVALQRSDFLSVRVVD